MTKGFAIVMATGILALVYGGVGASTSTQQATVGPWDITVALAVVSGGFLTRKGK